MKTSPIVNFYLLYKLLMEVAAVCEQKLIEDLSSSLFCNIDLPCVQQFANYILEKHEVLSLVYDDTSSLKPH